MISTILLILIGIKLQMGAIYYILLGITFTLRTSLSIWKIASSYKTRKELKEEEAKLLENLEKLKESLHD